MKQLISRLKRETKKSPKKVAILGCLMVVGIYFWAPLVSGWFGGSKNKKPKAKVTSTSQPTPTVVAQIITPKTQESKYRWQHLVAWINTNSDMQPAIKLPLGRNPFYDLNQTSNQNPQTDHAEIPEQNLKHKSWTPQNAGLVLTSTMIGPKRKIALINSRVYLLGSTIKVAISSSSSTGSEISAVNVTNKPYIEFQFVKIGPRWIDLSRNGKVFRLKILTNSATEDAIIQPAGATL